MNETQRLYWNTAAAPILANTLEAGQWSLTFDGEETDPLEWDDDAATVQAALENLPNIGAGNVEVTAEADGFTIEFVGDLADEDLPALTLTSATLTRRANTVNLDITQAGQATTPATPTNATTTAAAAPVAANPTNQIHLAAVAPVNEVQSIDLGGATSGSFDLTGNSTSATVNAPFDASGLQTALDAMWGSGNAYCTGSGPYSVEFTSAKAGQDIDQMGVANNSTDGSPSVSTTTAGQAGISQIDRCTFSATPIAGSMTFDGNSLAHNATPSAPFGASVSGTPASGTIETTWSDFTNHTPVSVDAGTLISAAGIKQVDTCTFSATPAAGAMTWDGNGLAYNATPSTPMGADSVTGTPAGGAITTTWSDFSSHTPITVAAGTLNANDGAPAEFTVTLDDAPTAGQWRLIAGAPWSSQTALAAAATADEVETALATNFPCNVTGALGGPYEFITTTDTGPSITADENPAEPLTKPATAEIVTVQDGEPDGNTPASFGASAPPNARGQADASKATSLALPGDGATAISPVIDLEWGPLADKRGLLATLNAPQLSDDELDNGETLRYTIQHAATADFAAPQDLHADAIQQAGANYTGAAALERRLTLPDNCGQFLRLVVVASANAAGDWHAARATLSVS